MAQGLVNFSAGYVPVEDIPQLLADADVGLIPLRLSSATDMMLPTKLLEYVQLGIPCVVPKTSTIARYFDETMVRFFVAEDPESLAAAVWTSTNTPRSARTYDIRPPGFLSRYRWSEHKKVYTDLVRSFCSVKMITWPRQEQACAMVWECFRTLADHELDARRYQRFLTVVIGVREPGALNC
jgi:glycosyltransferase involved in cell wall biosynthesis